MSCRVPICAQRGYAPPLSVCWPASRQAVPVFVVVVVVGHHAHDLDICRLLHRFIDSLSGWISVSCPSVWWRSLSSFYDTVTCGRCVFSARSPLCHAAADRRGSIEACCLVNGAGLWGGRPARAPHWGRRGGLQEMASLLQPLSSHTHPLHPHHPPHRHTRYQHWKHMGIVSIRFGKW